MNGGQLTVHVLDVARGVGAGGMEIAIERAEGDGWRPLKTVRTNASGLTDAPVLDEREFAPGAYRLTFEVEAYFAAHGVPTGDPAYLTQVPVQVTLGPGADHHLPLAVSPWSYTTFRGER